MRSIQIGITIVLLLLSATFSFAEQTLIEWRFDKPNEMLGWTNNSMLEDVEIKDGALQMRGADWDPNITSPDFEIPARPWQVIEFEMKADKPGNVAIFWAKDNEGPYGGFMTGKETSVPIFGDNKFHTYRITPFWHLEGKIIRLRFDPYEGASFSLRALRIVEPEQIPATSGSFDLRQPGHGWTPLSGFDEVRQTKSGLKLKLGTSEAMLASPLMPGLQNAGLFLNIRMQVDRGTVCLVRLAKTSWPGTQTMPVPLRPGSQMEQYCIPVADISQGLLLTPSNAAGAKVTIESIELSDRPTGQPALKLNGLAPNVPQVFARQRFPLTVVIRNEGGFEAKNLQLKIKSTPQLRVVKEPLNQPESLTYGDEVRLTWILRAQAEGEYAVTLMADCDEQLRTVTAQTKINVMPPSRLPRADYVPVPQPVKSDYRVGLYYFPGWKQGTHYGWDVIKNFPERMPMLGWYEEGIPEVHDWEIKWAIEHGIEFYLFDWYRASKGRAVETYLGAALDDGFMNARYFDMIKFAIMWENANAQGITDEEDMMTNLLPFWIEKYFSRENYLRVDGKPLLMVYYPPRLAEELGGADKVRPLLDKMREACRVQGLGGLYIIAACNDDESSLKAMQEQGYDATTHYAYNRPGTSKPVGRMVSYDYSEIIDLHEDIWKRKRDLGPIPDIPVLTMGWDPRPWHAANTWHYWTGNTPEKFVEMCRRAKQVSDTSEDNPSKGIILMEALNEWGEGSYLSPNRGFGFGHFDAIRKVFAPDAGPHEDITPWQIGLGPYEAKPPVISTAWDFEEDVSGWSTAMGLVNMQVKNGALCATTIDRDPSFTGPETRIRASELKRIVIRMKADKDTFAQLFWRTTLFPIDENSAVSFAVKGDNQYHDYALEVAKNPRWWGIINQLRFDPTDSPDINVAIDSIKAE